MQKPVLTIFYQFNPWRSSIGGIQTIIRSFLKYAPDTFDIRFVGTTDDPAEPLFTWQAANYAGRDLQFMPILTLQDNNYRKRIPVTVRYASALMRTCAESDFMHFHRLEPTIAARPWRGEKTLFVHNDLKRQASTQKFPALLNAFERYLIQQFDQVLSCHTGSLELYQERYPNLSDRMTYINNSYDDGIFQPVPDRVAHRRILARSLNLPEETQFILFAGRLQPQKDPVLLVQSIAALSHPKAHLLIAGDGELAPEIRAEIARLGVNATLLGAQTQAEMLKLYQAASVFVLSSQFEGLPVAVLEALGCGTPIVTTDCGDTPKLLSFQSGVVCSDRQAKTIADAIDLVLFNPDDFPITACLKSAQPYAARAIVSQVYEDMMSRWKIRSREQRSLAQAHT